MKTHSRKIAVVIIVSLCLIAYYILYTAIIVNLNFPAILKIGLTVLMVAVTITTVMVLVERIREIKRGEDDDLGKY